MFVVFPYGQNKLNDLKKYINNINHKIKFIICFLNVTHPNRYLNRKSHLHPAEIKTLIQRPIHIPDEDNIQQEIQIKMAI